MKILLLVCALWSSMYSDSSAKFNCWKNPGDKCDGPGEIGCQWWGECICKPTHYPNTNRRCISCPCKKSGMTGTCNRYGTCECKKTHYKVGSNCPKCPCDGTGFDGTCLNNGQCRCKRGYIELNVCKNCEFGFYKVGDECHDCKCTGKGLTGGCDSSGTCIKCNCTGNETTGECYPDGTCKCNPGFSFKGGNCTNCGCGVGSQWNIPVHCTRSGSCCKDYGYDLSSGGYCDGCECDYSGITDRCYAWCWGQYYPGVGAQG